jgi:hypothetical protein
MTEEDEGVEDTRAGNVVEERHEVPHEEQIGPGANPSLPFKMRYNTKARPTFP